ncbi:hypothetical protein [Actinokineospora sp. NBRC 105648]|uniref:hypothetical protein n=1 Tax=Actinokineospora sp. NBRC 105648 TaxID=3032206 RepID=UPI0025556599|nr:hypothetical protein [Actinokineospora sp. NBRC 105648]
MYGTRPDLLPRSMVRVVRADQPWDRLLSWVGRPGVELLDLDRHLRTERASLDRYPRDTDGTIEWAAVPPGLVLRTADSESVDLGVVVEHDMPAARSVILLWASPAIPSVELAVGSAAPRFVDIVERAAEFWVYSPVDQVVVEYSFSGVVTAARLPPGADGPAAG